MIIIDEAPKFIKNNALKINEKTLELEGVYPLIGKRFLMCSATISRMYKKIMKDILGVPDNAFMKLPDTQEIIT